MYELFSIIWTKIQGKVFSNRYHEKKDSLYNVTSINPHFDLIELQSRSSDDKISLTLDRGNKLFPRTLWMILFEVMTL